MQQKMKKIQNYIQKVYIYAKRQRKDKQRDADKWHKEACGPARRLRGGRGVIVILWEAAGRELGPQLAQRRVGEEVPV